MHRQQKIQDILIALLMTWVEDQFVKVEHREPQADPPTCSFQEQFIKMAKGEAKNCDYTLDSGDEAWLLDQMNRVDRFVRK